MLPLRYHAVIQSLDMWEAGSHIDLDFIMHQSMKLITNPSVTRLTHLYEQVLVHSDNIVSRSVCLLPAGTLGDDGRKQKKMVSQKEQDKSRDWLSFIELFVYLRKQRKTMGSTKIE